MHHSDHAVTEETMGLEASPDGQAAAAADESRKLSKSVSYAAASLQTSLSADSAQELWTPSFAYKRAAAWCCIVTVCTALLCMYPVFQQNLRVERMEASNPADKRMILERIGDTAGFNAQVQTLLFCTVTGLLSAWTVSGDLPAALKFMSSRAKERKVAAAEAPQEPPQDDAEAGELPSSRFVISL
eukprot:TRINITY_DN15106_c0_g1_i3.p1 TRINITY_DN15106_c0_g1~~TRINITY_DN15106_c0_g1_i3.p1  ORF type:complete len:186 (-),score=39.14 TRINITY_DN15106_c0_g1_i3:152-709(-)